MSLPRAFTTFAEFERDYLRGGSRLGLSLEEMVEDSSFDSEIELSEFDDVDDDDY